MSDSDSGWQRPKRRKTKEERLMAALKAVMRDGSSRAESQPLSQQAEGVQGASQPHQGPDTGQTGKASQTLHEATHSEGSTHQQRMADDTQGASPMPQNAPQSLEPCAPQGGGHGSHGPSPHNLGGCRQGQVGPTTHQAGKASPAPEVPIKDGETNTQDAQVAHYEEPSQPSPKDAASGMISKPK